MKYKGYVIWDPLIDGKNNYGKFGRASKTSSIQVREPAGDHGYFLKKRFRYTKGNFLERQSAVDKAKQHIDKLTNKKDENIQT